MVLGLEPRALLVVDRHSTTEPVLPPICSFSLLKISLLYIYHMCVWYFWMPRGNIEPPGTGVTDNCGLPDLGAENQTWIL